MTTSDTLIAETGKNIQEKATLIWNVANTLFGAFKPHEYGLVILPMVVIKRFHDCLLPTHQAVLDTYKKVEHLAVKEGFLRTAAGYQFYNTSPFTFETLRADPENINDNFRAYLNGFSDNVQDILSRMNFSAQIDRMEEAGLLQFSVPIPPLTEQEKIITILDRNTATINEVIAEKETLVSDLESYKKSLIYEVVTGKRRV